VPHPVTLLRALRAATAADIAAGPCIGGRGGRGWWAPQAPAFRQRMPPTFARLLRAAYW
jgi:hypothetical protein